MQFCVSTCTCQKLRSWQNCIKWSDWVYWRKLIQHTSRNYNLHFQDLGVLHKIRTKSKCSYIQGFISNLITSTSTSTSSLNNLGLIILGNVFYLAALKRCLLELSMTELVYLNCILVTCEFELVIRRFELVTGGFKLVTHWFKLVIRGFEIALLNFSSCF